MAPKVILAGGSGLIGTALANHFTQSGYEVVILSRKTRPDQTNIRYVQWDGKNLDQWASELEGTHAVVNLTGKSIDCLPSEKNYQLCLDSRIQSIEALSLAFQSCKNPPGVWIQSSAVGFYGDSGQEICNEDSPSNPTDLMKLCGQWEEAFNQLDLPNTRKVTFRIGVVFSNKGGALGKLAGLVRMFLGGTAGSGNQYASWIDIRDLSSMFYFAVENQSLEGIFNATSPNPITNRQLMSTLRKVLRRPWCPPAPSFAVKIGALAMGTNPALALESQRCSSQKIIDQGFQFSHSNLEDSLRFHLYERNRK